MLTRHRGDRADSELLAVDLDHTDTATAATTTLVAGPIRAIAAARRRRDPAVAAVATAARSTGAAGAGYHCGRRFIACPTIVAVAAFTAATAIREHVRAGLDLDRRCIETDHA